MRKFAILMLLSVCVAGCARRVPTYSPRRTDTKAHREAQTRAECINCHKADQIRGHTNTDDCLRCHRICEGC
jgi:hypothetical protein